jgi:primosomal protein N' (replication factor Y)
VLVQRGPNVDVDALIETLAARGSVLVVSPTLARAREQVGRLRRQGLTVASLPDEWAGAAGGMDVVVGARTAVWASVPELGGVVVIDEHDEALQEERVPTWHAREVAIERARASGAPCVLVSPLPSAAAFAAARNASWEEGFAWPQIEIVDRSTDERWSKSLISSRLVEVVRDPSLRVVVVHNVKGRSQLMACSSCRRLVTCDVCAGPMAADDAGGLVCRRCQQARPSLCISCGSSTLANLRPGVGRLRDDLLKASGRLPSEVSVVTSASDQVDQRASLFIGTEAAIHRVHQPDVIVFADIDHELRAPRYRSSEITGALIISAARKVGFGRLVIQTHSPDHPLLHALSSGNVRSYVESEASVREVLGLPPFGALARVTGAGAEVVSDALRGHLLVEVTMASDAKSSKECLVRARSVDDLLGALQSVLMPKGTRVSVDPPRV